MICLPTLARVQKAFLAGAEGNPPWNTIWDMIMSKLTDRISVRVGKQFESCFINKRKLLVMPWDSLLQHTIYSFSLFIET